MYVRPSDRDLYLIIHGSLHIANSQCKIQLVWGLKKITKYSLCAKFTSYDFFTATKIALCKDPVYYAG